MLNHIKYKRVPAEGRKLLQMQGGMKK